MPNRLCALLFTAFALGRLVVPLDAQVSAMGVTDLYHAAAGSTWNQLPAATPLTNAVLQVTASTTSGTCAS